MFEKAKRNNLLNATLLLLNNGVIDKDSYDSFTTKIYKKYPLKEQVI